MHGPKILELVGAAVSDGDDVVSLEGIEDSLAFTADGTDGRAAYNSPGPCSPVTAATVGARRIAVALNRHMGAPRPPACGNLAKGSDGYQAARARRSSGMNGSPTQLSSSQVIPLSTHRA